MSKEPEQASSEKWRKWLIEGETSPHVLRRVLRRVPSPPRCGMCLAPFRGAGGRVLKVVGFGVSRKNPNWCNRCFEKAPLGGAEIDTGVLFADVRGFTSMSETRAPEEVARLLNRLYAVAANVLARHDAVIDKLVGDEVMALFVSGFAGPEYVSKMVGAAEGLLRGVGYAPGEAPWLPLGLGLDCGVAFVGNVGSGEVKDFTALGDVVNTAARLQSQAKPGQIVMSERVFGEVPGRFPDARSVSLELKGKSEPVAARVVNLVAAPAGVR